MDELFKGCPALLNTAGKGFWGYASGTFIQSGVLVVLLLIVDLLIRRRVRATIRYWIWMLVFIKLLLPPTLSLPTGIGYWCGRYAPVVSIVGERSLRETGYREDIRPPAVGFHTVSDKKPQIQPPANDTKTVVSVTPKVRDLEPLTWQAYVFMFWIAGMVGLSLFMIQRVIYVRRLFAWSESADERVQEALDVCQRRIGVRSSIGLRLSHNAPSPAVCGLFKPTILMPVGLPNTLSDDSLRAVLSHELGHIKRGDLWINTAQTILLIIHFYNPFVWLANRFVRRLREQAVDEMVLVALGIQTRTYSTMLVEIGEMAFSRRPLALRLIGVAESKNSLEGRIKHMLSRPVPRSASIGLWGFVAILTMAAVFLPMARAQVTDAQNEGSDGYGILLLDDRDPESKGKDSYDDRLYLLDSRGNVEGAVSGFNISESIGSHMMAVDPKRKTVWVTENSGDRLWHLDLATGRLLGQTPGLKADACTVDPDTGNAWVVISEGLIGEGHIQVVSPSGKPLIQYPIPGHDIDYSRPDGTFWVVGKDIFRLNKEGKFLGQIKGQIPHTAISVSIDQKTGAAWIVVRDHSQVPESRPEVWVVDPNMQIRKRIDLGDLVPFCVAVDSDNEVVWVGCLGTTLHFTTKGIKLPSARSTPGFSVVPAGSASSVWAADRFDVMKANVRESGYVELGLLRGHENQPQLGFNQRWLAMVPFAGARLQSSKELTSMTEYKARQQWLAEHPELEARLRRLGQALMMYANDYEDKFPDTLQDIQRSGGKEVLSDEDLKWLTENVEYRGKGKTTSLPGDTVIAYDKTMAEEGKGTLVLYADSAVKYESPQQLERRGIKARP